MSLHREYERPSFIDFEHEDIADLSHKKQVRQRLENRMERKRLKEELEFFDGELDGEFDWDYLDK